MAEKVRIVDDGEEFADLETAKKFDEAFRFSKNLAGDNDVSDRARKRVWECLASAEQTVADMKGSWSDAERLLRMESLSENANDFDVHLGSAFRANEEWVARMHQSIYGTGAKLVGGDILDDGDEDRKEAIFALLEHQLREEAKVTKRAQEDFRMVGAYGSRFYKVFPKREVFHTFDMKRRSRRLDDGSVVYEFDAPEEKERVRDVLQKQPISVYDFRADTATDIESATWCGDYSYPNIKEVQDLKERGEYEGAQLDEILSKAEKSKGPNAGPSAINATTERAIRRNSIGILPMDRADEVTADGLTHFARFEWWGLFDLEDNGKPRQCVITMLVPMQSGKPHFASGPTSGAVVRVCRNPFAHQKKPYTFHPVIKFSGTMYGVSVLDLKGRMSRFEDEMWTLGLTGAQLESSPPIEIGSDADVDPETVDSFLPGLRIPVDRTGQIRGIDLPQKSGIAGNWAKILDDRGDDVVGIGGPEAAPRVAAAGILTEANREDLRLVLYVDAWEQYDHLPSLEFAHSYIRQYMTHERKIRSFGIGGIGLPDIRTVRPDQVDHDVMFAPMVGRKLRQKVFQAQQLLNLRDRFMMQNQMDMQMGKSPSRDLDELDRRILKDGIGIADVDSIISVNDDPDKVLTAGQEHRLFAAGQRPGVQKAENKLMHFLAHFQAISPGGEAEEWRDDDRQALIDHAYETLDDLFRELEQGMPGMGEVVALMKEQQLAPYQPTMEGREDYFQRRQGANAEAQSAAGQGGQPGGRGAAQATQGPGSPLFRAPGLQGEVMGQSPNLGAQ